MRGKKLKWAAETGAHVLKQERGARMARLQPLGPGRAFVAGFRRIQSVPGLPVGIQFWCRTQIEI